MSRTLEAANVFSVKSVTVSRVRVGVHVPDVPTGVVYVGRHQHDGQLNDHRSTVRQLISLRCKRAI